MPLTDEQLAVVEADAPILKVNAVAGSGKTLTLIAFAAHHPQSKILYLAYNKSVAVEMREKAKASGLGNLTVYTIHALAYRHAHGHSYELESDCSEWRLLDQYVPATMRGTEQGMVYAWLLKDLVNFYLNAELTRLDADLLAAYVAITLPGAEAGDLLAARGEEMIGLVRNILSDMKNRKAPALHDFYLKMFQFTKVRLPYDVILVDEAQDTSGVMLSIINRQDHARRIFVGDSYQQIYAFRHAVNSLDRVDGESLLLSQTFRFGDALAQQISQRVNQGYELLGAAPEFKMTGMDMDTRYGKRAYKGKYPLAVIARSNLSLFESVLGHLYGKGAKSMHFEGGYPGYSFMNARVASLLYLKEEKRDKINEPLIKKFKAFEDVRRFANDTQNHGLSTMVDLVTKYGGKLFDFDKQIKARLVDKAQAELVFTTTHKAKGQEYDIVEMVKNDFATRSDLLKQLNADKEEVSLVKLREEINIYYVAATRGKKSVTLAEF
jgi:superfamily I DNA/RNA helicase